MAKAQLYNVVAHWKSGDKKKGKESSLEWHLYLNKWRTEILFTDENSDEVAGLKVEDTEISFRDIRFFFTKKHPD